MAYNSHGHTPAAWTAVIMIVAGFVVGGIGVMMLNWQVFWFGGVGLIVLGGIAGKVLQMMGFGQHERMSSKEQSPESVPAGSEGRDG
ncbi:HGxxPAAW family protein [Phytoactinopolyspora halophila]|uniref:HGxxPAAW family protein n=1 Tax=Phytoactinopolyspora halophila TaxID=1981511 RepID=UPI001B8BFF30|nr:HGxxPAAW family protein [Phytoactinopolyspora halophila]